MKYIILIFIVLLIGCQEESVDCSPYSKSGDIHTWNGGIELDSYECFEWSEGDTLSITSEGGYTTGAAQIITDIISFKINVIAVDYCHSSCAYILSHGVERAVDCFATVGIHEDDFGNQNLYLFSDRVDLESVSHVMPEYDDLYSMYSLEAIRLGLVDYQIPC